ncbi:MAG: hypothetical protein QOK44_3871 [Betaproteobacteria bacterium]|jgi:hypothetical protein|nr:hypothetical protein [Betaproteobacteria bacterium]
MDSAELPVVLTADDRHLIESKLAGLAERPDAIGGMTVFLPRAEQVLVLFTVNGEIANWCLMPARDRDHAFALAARIHEVHRKELEVVWGDVKATADAAIRRASRAARGEALRAARKHRNDTYPGEWDCEV